MRTIPLSLLVLGACSDYNIEKNSELVGGNEEEGVPDILVDPETIDFGSIDVGSEMTVVETVTVSNQGDAALEIQDMYLENPELASVFSVSAIGSVLIPPGSSTTFTVTFEPDTATDSETRILIESNDPDEAQSAVNLLGDGVAPVIDISPDSYDFGTLYIGCDNALPVTISNVGNADLVVSDFSYISASDDLYFDANTAVNLELPWTLAPGDSAEVYVSYAPLDDYSDEGYLTVASNDPFQPEAQVSQSGNGALYGENLDVFEQPIRGSSDILFVVDNSCSMADEQANLAANFAVFAATIAEMDVDYQLAVITTDNPAFRGAIMTEETDDLEAEFIAQSGVGTMGSGDERPTEMAYQSTQSGGDAGPGSDFLRDDAMFSMIFVSDEPDSSTSPWADYLAYFQGIKDDDDDFIAHAISGDWPSGCGAASATNNVYELTVATGGLYLSVCATDWASHLEALVEGSAEDLSSFELSEWPVPESIVVRVDGANTTTGWEYNETDNSIDFDESSIPEGGSTIEVQYALFGDCEG